MRIKTLMISSIIASVLTLVLFFYHPLSTSKDEVDALLKDTSIVYLNNHNYNFLTDIGNNSKIIAIGESTHGSQEFNKIRLQAFKHLVEHCGYSLFLIEADFGDFLPITEYIASGKGNPGELLSGAGWWLWNTEEMIEIIRWMRSYNTNPNNTNKLSLIGVDPRHKIRILHFLISVYGEQGIESAKQVVAQARGMFAPKSGTKEYKEKLSVLLALIKKSRPIMQQPESISQNLLVDLCTTILSQQHLLKKTGGLQNQLNLRDRLMAENVGYITDRTGLKSMFAAHSGHIRASEQNILDAILKRRVSGNFLKKKYKEAYYSLYIDFAQGYARAKDETGDGAIKPCFIPFKKRSISYYLHRANTPPLFLDFKRLNNGSVEILNKYLTFNSIGSTYSGENNTKKRFNIYKNFDGYIYLPKVTASIRQRKNAL